MYKISLLILLGVASLTAAQPTVTILNNQLVGCPNEAVSYRCEGVGPILLWDIGGSQVTYDAVNDQLGEGNIRTSESVTTSLVQRTPFVASILTVYQGTNVQLNFTCATGPDLASLIVADSPASYIPEPIANLSDLSMQPRPAGINIGVVEVFYRASADQLLLAGDCVLQLFIGEVLSRSLVVSLESSQVEIPFSRPSGGESSVNIRISGRIITECNGTSPLVTTEMMYTFENDGSQGLLIAVIILAVVCFVLLVTVIGLAIGLHCEKKKPPPPVPDYPLVGNSLKPTVT